VPADGFYEWQQQPSGKQAFYIHRKDGQLLAMAGLWEHWTPPGTQDSVQTFTILTAEANDLMRPLHERMPVVLQEEDLARWLDPTAKPVDLQALMRPLGDSALDAYPVGKAVGNVRNDVPTLLDAV
jgi:putative SOS response-associated peptidase YedK